MRLPWVSREMYEDLRRLTAAAVGDLHSALASEHKRYDRLLTMYHELALRVSGPPPVSVARAFGQTEDIPVILNKTEGPVRVASVIAQTIREEAGGDERTARYLWKRAGELRAENKKPEEIAQELRAWQTTEVEAE